MSRSPRDDRHVNGSARPGRSVQNRVALDRCHPRSEEHTSELQSIIRKSYAVFCLKKKKNTPHKLNKIVYDNQTKNERGERRHTRKSNKIRVILNNKSTTQQTDHK